MTPSKIKDSIDKKLSDALAPSYLKLVNESSGHNVPENSETHFNVTLVCEQFSDLSRVKRHQCVYAILAEELAGGVHALALHLYSPIEWQTLENVPQSPPCLGGSKT